MRVHGTQYIRLVILALASSDFTGVTTVSAAETSGTIFMRPHAPREADEAASRGMLTIEKLIKKDKQIAPFLGFRSTGEAAVDSMRLGPALPVVGIALEGLKKYTPGDRVSTLLRPTDEFIYPISIGDKVQSAITVKKSKSTGRWQIAFGAVAAPRAASQLNISYSAFVLRIYASNQWFLATASGNEMKLVPLGIDPAKEGADSTLQIGKQEDARDVFARLAPEAKQTDYSGHRVSKRRRINNYLNQRGQ